MREERTQQSWQKAGTKPGDGTLRRVTSRTCVVLPRYPTLARPGQRQVTPPRAPRVPRRGCRGYSAPWQPGCGKTRDSTWRSPRETRGVVGLSGAHFSPGFSPASSPTKLHPRAHRMQHPNRQFNQHPNQSSNHFSGTHSAYRQYPQLPGSGYPPVHLRPPRPGSKARMARNIPGNSGYPWKFGASFRVPGPPACSYSTSMGPAGHPPSRARRRYPG